MISKDCFSNEWIENVKRRFAGSDPTLIEKSIHAYEFLGRLAEENIEFTFKGGSSLPLILPQFRRFSIDLDIVCAEPVEKLVGVFERLGRMDPFLSWVEDQRPFSGVPKRHFKFRYQSKINKKEDYILLDILTENLPIDRTVMIKVALPFFITETDIFVRLPTIDCLIGDKLTAFAPVTIGIPYGERNSLTIIKQLYDLGMLCDSATDVRELSESYDIFLSAQNRYRSTSHTREAALNDTIEACFLICRLGFKTSVENDQTMVFRSGIERIKNYLINTRFPLVDVKRSASKIAVMAAVVKHRHFDFRPGIFWKKPFIKPPTDQLNERYRSLERLKTLIPDAFVCWCFISGIEDNGGKSKA